MGSIFSMRLNADVTNEAADKRGLGVHTPGCSGFRDLNSTPGTPEGLTLANRPNVPLHGH